MSAQHQTADLYQPIVASRVGPAPIALRVGVTPQPMEMEGGTSGSKMQVETYVLLSALPFELQERVKLAIQALIAGR